MRVERSHIGEMFQLSVDVQCTWCVCLGDWDVGSAGEDAAVWKQVLSSVIAEVFMSKCDNEIVIFLIIMAPIGPRQVIHTSGTTNLRR